MAACGGVKHFFEKPFSENSTILDPPSSWNQINSMKPIKDSSFTKIFEESHFKENSSVSSTSSFSSNNLPPLSASSSSSSSSSTSSSYNYSSISLETIHQSGIEGINRDPITGSKEKHYRHSDSFSSRNSDSLSLCTEGLGFESSDDVEDIMNELVNGNDQEHEEIRSIARINNQGISHEYSKIRSRTNKGSLLPPPMSCIGRNGKPWVCFESFRQDGRFILKEIRIPGWEFLHACREDGRLKLHIVQSDDEFLEEDEEYDDDSDDVEEQESIEEVTNDDEKREVGEFY